MLQCKIYIDFNSHYQAGEYIYHYISKSYHNELVCSLSRENYELDF